MAQDTALLRYLLKGARRAPGSGSQRDLTFQFDGTDDYISSNTTIGRTGYDMNVSGNVSTGSDADGSYFWINGNRDATGATGTQANLDGGTTPLFGQTTSFTISTKVKINTLPPNQVSGIFASSFDAGFHTDSGGNNIIYGLRGSTTVQNVAAGAFVLGTVFTFHQVYDATTAKFYGYLNGTLLNVGGTAGPTTFSTNDRWLGDSGITGSTPSSCDKYIYHAAIRNRALSQADINADIALGNTAKNDPSIVAYYIPDNLTYNTQYGSNPKALDQSNWVKTGATTVTANTTVAPDGTTTADTVAISGTASQGCTTIVNSISGATIASKTFIVKAFVKVAAGTSLFRLECSHNGVATYNSSDKTATTTRQEFTFTQTFTSAAGGTGITYGLDNSTGATNPTLQARNVRLFLVNETLRDESPNIGGFIGWKTPLVMSARVKTGIDASDTFNSQVIIKAPRHYLQVRGTTNIVNRRSETTLQARVAGTGGTAILGTGNRNKVNIVVYKYRDGTGWLYETYVNGVKTTGTTSTYSTTIRPASTIYTTQLLVGKDSTATYYTGDIRDARIYTFTGSFTNADALAIYNGGEPISSGITKYLHYRPPVGEVGTTTQDQSTNDRDGTLNNGVTRVYI